MPTGQNRLAVFTIVNGQGVWNLANGQTVTFGQAGDIPVPGDYTGVGYDELAVYRPSHGQTRRSSWYRSQGQTIPRPPRRSRYPDSIPDLTSLVPVPGAYDNQYYFDNNEPENTEAAVYDPTTGTYTILGPSTATDPSGVYTVTFDPGDIPAPADYLGNGSTQPAVFRPSNGNFYEIIGGTQTVIASFGSGASADIPLNAPLSYRMPSTTDPLSTGGGKRNGDNGSGNNRYRNNGNGNNRYRNNGNGNNRYWNSGERILIIGAGFVGFVECHGGFKWDFNPHSHSHPDSHQRS